MLRQVAAMKLSLLTVREFNLADLACLGPTEERRC